MFLDIKIITDDNTDTTIDTNKVEGSEDKSLETQLGDNTELL